MKKLLLAVLSAVCAVSLTVAATACTKVQPSTKFEAPDQPEQKSQELGSDFSFPSLAGKYGETTVTPVITVTYGGNSVETEKDGFRLDKVGEYTITYTFTYGDGETYTMTQKVISVDAVAPTVVIGELQGKYKYDETVEIPEIQVVDLSGEEIQATVSVHIGSQDSTETVKVENGSFKVKSYEQHFIVAEATDSSGNKGTGVASFAVQQEGEIEFFNSKSYTLKNYLPDNASLDFNTDAKYIFEGEGSAHVTNTSTGVYSGFILRNTYGTAYKDAVSAVMWVYNNSAKDVNINVVICEEKTDGGILERETIASFTAPAGMWSKMELNAEELAKIGEKQFLKLYMGKEINPEMYNQLDVYFDAFKVYTADTLPAYSVNPEKIITNCEGKENIPVLSVEQITGITDIVNVSAILVNQETGAKTQLTATEQGISIPAATGSYNVYYLYKNGSDGVTAEQEVILYDNASQHLYQKTYGIENFEENLPVLDSQYYSFLKGNASGSKYSFGDEHGNALKIVNMPAADSANKNLHFVMKPSMLEDLSATDVLTFDFMIEKPADAANYCIRLFKADTEQDLSTGKVWVKQDATNFGEWDSITLSGAAVEDVIASGGFGFFVLINKTGGGNCENYTVYVDNIRIEKANLNDDGSKTLSQMLEQTFPGAQTNVISVKGSDGEDYTLTEDKFTVSDVYTVKVSVSEEGMNASEYELKIIVAGPDTFESFEGEFNGSLYKVQDGGTANVSFSADKAYSGTKSLKVENGQWSAYTFVDVSLTDAMKAAITDGNNLKLRLFLDKGTSDGASFNLRIKTTVGDVTTYFAYQDSLQTGTWLEIIFNTEDGGKPCDIMHVVQSGGFTIQIEQVGGANSWAYSYYIDDLQVISK